MPEQCGNCRYYWDRPPSEIRGPGKTEQFGQCRRYPPPPPGGEWPATPKDGWCGEYEAAP